MRKLLLFAMLIGTAHLSRAEAKGPYRTLGVPEDGTWTKASCNFKLPNDIGLLSSGYVYTNKLGVVHQFNFTHTFSVKVQKESAIVALKETENALADLMEISPFKPHIDSNPNRYLWAEESSLTKYPGWSIRLYLEKDAKRNTLVAKCSVWNAKFQ